RDAVATFGLRVLAIVEGCTEHRPVPKPPWRERKERYIELSQPPTPRCSSSRVPTSCTTRAPWLPTCVIPAPRLGPIQRRPHDTLWYYGAVIEAMRGNPAHPADLVDELERVVTELASIMDWRPAGPMRNAQP
ncbi:MAG TPA: hypothetical protein VFK04_03040, partial [Gemmatimonadaceae bacterium]|nr:hypothetical protein [Gemmatimonadaceae bacterium]